MSFYSSRVLTLTNDSAENDVGKSAGQIEAIRTAFKEGYATILQLSLTPGASLLGPFVSLNQWVCLRIPAVVCYVS